MNNSSLDTVDNVRPPRVLGPNSRPRQIPTDGVEKVPQHSGHRRRPRAGELARLDSIIVLKVMKGLCKLFR